MPANVLLYNRSAGSPSSVYRIAPDGSGNQLYASLPAGYVSFAHSPADAKLAFAYSAGAYAFQVMVNASIDNAGATVVDPGPYSFVGSVQFTPDGSKLVYVAQGATGASGLFVANADGSGTPTRLDDADDASLGAGGTEIAYTRPYTNGEICLRKIDGTGFARITSNASEDYMPQWSKDGLKLYFTSDRSGSNAIWVMGWNGSSPAQVTSGQGEYGASPNTAGTRVAFTRVNINSSLTGIYTIAPDGSGETAVVLSPDVVPGVSWTSDYGRAVGGIGCGGPTLSPRTRRLVGK